MHYKHIIFLLERSIIKEGSIISYVKKYIWQLDESLKCTQTAPTGCKRSRFLAKFWIMLMHLVELCSWTIYYFNCILEGYSYELLEVRNDIKFFADCTYIVAQTTWIKLEVRKLNSQEWITDIHTNAHRWNKIKACRI